MPRVPRWMQLARDAGYHVLSRGHNRGVVFADADDCRYFLGLLDRYRRRFGFRLYHYCLMTNHIHLLLQLDDPRRLSALMAGLLLAYVRYCNGRYGFVGHLFQGRFKSPLVQREGYWLSCGRYIERNPVEAGLVAAPWDYPWSSCRAYALGEANPLLTEDPCYTALAPDAARRQQLWRSSCAARTRGRRRSGAAIGRWARTASAGAWPRCWAGPCRAPGGARPRLEGPRGVIYDTRGPVVGNCEKRPHSPRRQARPRAPGAAPFPDFSRAGSRFVPAYE